MSKIVKKDEEWKELLNQESYRVTRQSATEKPFTGKYWDFNKEGMYKCICCGEDLFESKTKFDAGCGWPSFFIPHNMESINEFEVLKKMVQKIILENEKLKKSQKKPSVKKKKILKTKKKAKKT